MSRQPLSRRTVLGAGAAATAATAAATVIRPGIAMADDPPPRPPLPETAIGASTETLATPASGEQVIFYTPAALVPNGTSAGASSVYDATVRGARPMGTGAVISASVNVPLGAKITGIEFVIAGTPQAGSVNFSKYVAETAADVTSLYTQVVSATGISVYASAALNEVFDGSQTFEAYYSTVATTSFCKGIRVRYLPAASGLLIPITPARVYDSRLNMSPDANGPLSLGANRLVSIANSRNITNGTILTEVVPASATAIAYTLTAANTVGAGFLAVNPGGTTVVSASTINWVTANDNIANTGVVKLNASRQVSVVHGGGGGADFVIDVVGYYR